MKRLRSNQAGFSVGAVIIVVLVLLVIGGIGFILFKKSADSNNSATTTSPTPSPKDTDSTDLDTETPIDPSDDGKYLVIKEWGVRVLLPDSLKGNAFYSLREFEESYGHAEAASINSKFFQPECRDTAEDLSLDVMRTTAKLDETARAYKRNVFQSGNYWYHNIFGHDGCSKFLEGEKADVFNDLYESIGAVEAY